jgi:hypothetical protein
MLKKSTPLFFKRKVLIVIVVTATHDIRSFLYPFDCFHKEKANRGIRFQI